MSDTATAPAAVPADLRHLGQEMIKANELARQLREAFGEDDELIADMIEGETNLAELIPLIAKQIVENNIMLSGVKAHMESVKKRAELLDARCDRLKATMVAALAAANKSRYEGPEGVFSRRKSPGSVVIDDEASIPAIIGNHALWSTPKAPDPKPDKRAIGDLLKAGVDVPGCRLVVSESLQIK